MFDFGSLLAISTMVAVRDYYNDKQKIEREKRHEYRLCFDSIGDNAELLGNTILSTLTRSGRTDLENEIVAGSQELLLYILQEVVRVQRKPITIHQKKIIDICFNNFNFIRITRQEFVRAINGDVSAGSKLEQSVGMSKTTCGVFWNHFIGIMYDTNMSETNFKTIIDCYAEIVCRFAILGDCSIDVAESVYKKFIDGFNEQLKKKITKNNVVYAENTDKYKESINHYIDEMKQNCEVIAEIDHNDDILVELFNYFVASVFIGFLDSVQVKKEKKVEILQELIDISNLEVGTSAEFIYETYTFNEGVRKTFYDSANNWSDANYWKVHLIATIKSDITEMTIDFLDLAMSLMQNIEKYVIATFGIPNCNGKADKYMTSVINQMKSLGIDNIVPSEEAPKEESISSVKDVNIKDEKISNNKEVTESEVFKSVLLSGMPLSVVNRKYDAAIKKMQSNDVLKLQECIFEFEELGDWKDSIKNKEKCTKMVFDLLKNNPEGNTSEGINNQSANEQTGSKRKLLKNNNEKRNEEDTTRRYITIGAVICVILMLIIVLWVSPTIKKNKAYDEACMYLSYGMYDDAILIFTELEEYKDSSEKILEAMYSQANEYLDDGEYDAAIEKFEQLDGYKNADEKILEAIYRKADELYYVGRYDEALAIFTTIKDYKDSKEIMYDIFDEFYYMESGTEKKEDGYGFPENGSVKYNSIVDNGSTYYDVYAEVWKDGTFSLAYNLYDKEPIGNYSSHITRRGIIPYGAKLTWDDKNKYYVIDSSEGKIMVKIAENAISIKCFEPNKETDIFDGVYLVSEED